jgi:hypothetical protein
MRLTPAGSVILDINQIKSMMIVYVDIISKVFEARTRRSRLRGQFPHDLRSTEALRAVPHVCDGIDLRCRGQSPGRRLLIKQFKQFKQQFGDHERSRHERGRHERGYR